jgi:hypothetical protein
MGTDFYMFGYATLEYYRKFGNAGSVDKICTEWRKSRNGKLIRS